MVSPFIDYTTIAQLQERVSLIEAQVGLTNTTNTDISANGLFFVASVSGAAVPTTPTDLSKIRVAALERVFDIAKQPIGVPRTVNIPSFSGCQNAYFSVTPRVIDRKGIADDYDGDISFKYSWNNDTQTLTYYVSRDPRSLDLSKMGQLQISASIIGIAIYP